MGFLQNSLPTVTTSITKCCLSATAFPFASLLDLVGYPCFGAGELLRAQPGSGHPRKQLPSTGEQEGWHRLAGGLRKGGSEPPTQQQSKGEGTSLTTPGGSLQEAACTGSSWHPRGTASALRALRRPGEQHSASGEGGCQLSSLPT